MLPSAQHRDASVVACCPGSRCYLLYDMYEAPEALNSRPLGLFVQCSLKIEEMLACDLYRQPPMVGMIRYGCHRPAL